MTRPLEGQEIHRNDSLFGRHGPKGDLRDWSGRGLKSYLKYKDLIKKAFHKKYWGATGRYVVTDDGRLRRTFLGGYSHMEQNFSLFWGLSIMLYEATLISDQSRFDQANDALGGCLTQFAGPCDPSQAGFTELEADGFTLFRGGLGPTPGGACVACHGGPLLSAAAVTADQPPLPPVNRLPPRSGQPTLEDTGFFGIGTRPVTEDRGLGGTDPYGNPLSFTRQYKAGLGDGANGTPDPDAMVDDFEVDPCADFLAPFAPDCSLPPTGAAAAGLRVGVDSAVKAPSLRNVALTPPYFHYGGYASLEQVIEFYARGGSRRDIDATGDNSGTGPLGEGNPDGSIPVAGPPFGSNTSGIINPLNLALGGAKNQEYGIRALVAFMKTTTDPRVQCDAAPFDHPQLYLTHGHHEYDADRDGRADDVVVELPAVGQYGYADERPDLCIPNAGDLFADGMLNRVLD
jgi:cytochrome c peroxidase